MSIFLDRLRRHHAKLQDTDWHHDGYMNCSCLIAQKIRDLISQNRPPLPHRLASID